MTWLEIAGAYLLAPLATVGILYGVLTLPVWIAKKQEEK